MADERFEIEKISPVEIASSKLSGTAISVGYRDYGYGYGRGDDKAQLREMWRALRKRKWLIASIVLIVTSLVTIEMIRAKAMYQATTIIEIGKENSTVVKSGDLVINDDSDPQYQVNLRTKVLMLNSRELHEDVIANLKLDQNSKFVQADEKSLWNTLKTFIGRNENKSETEESEVFEGDMDEDTTARSPEETARLAPYVEALEENLTIEPLRDTRALKVAFTHTDAPIAAAVVNGIARAFKQRNFQAKTEKYTHTASWLDASTRELKAKVEQAEQALANYTSDHNIFSINDERNQQATLTTEKLARLHDQLLRSETDRMLKQTLYQEVKDGHIAQLPDAFSDPRLGELQKQFNELQTTSAQLRVKYGPKNSRVMEVQQQMTTVQEQINATRGNLEKKLQLDYERAVQDESSLKGALEKSKGEAAQENQAAIQYNILKQTSHGPFALHGLFAEDESGKGAVAEQHNNIRVIERAAVPKKPVGPKRALMMMLAFMVSLAGSVGLVFLLEYLDNTIKNVEDVARYVQLPALGVIPAISASSARRLAAKTQASTKQFPKVRSCRDWASSSPAS